MEHGYQSAATAAPVADALPLPTRVEQIDAGWMTRALAITSPGLVVETCRIIDVIPGTSTKIRVALDYAPGASSAEMPRSLIVKGGFDTHSRNLGPMYLNEIRFYRDVAPYVTLTCPKAYFTATDTSSHQSVVIMEDLALRGVSFLDPLVPQEYQSVAWRLRSLARYHAETWNAREFEPGERWDWVRNRFSAFSMEYSSRYLEPEVWRQYMASPRGAAVSVSLHDRDWMAHALRRLGEIEAAADTCLIHGDTHLGNLYVEADQRPGFLDMQVTRSHWALEVAYHIASAIDISNRRRWEGALLEVYLSALRVHGIAAPAFDHAWKDYVRFLAYGYFIFIINETRFQTESVNTAHAARFAAAMIDHGTKQALT